jgi:arylsulfatase A-like enzyme
VATFLQQKGYATAVFGKWHLGVDWPRTGPNEADVDLSKPIGGGPLAHGFERFFGISVSLDMPPYVWLDQDRVVTVPTRRVDDSPPPQFWNGRPISSDFEMHSVEPRLIDAAAQYLVERAMDPGHRPFFLYLPLAAPHTPIVPTAEFVGRTRTTEYGDFVTQVDADVGWLLDVLDEQGLTDTTIVIVTSDSGFSPAADLPALQRLHHDPSAGFRGSKTDFYEGGHRVPFIVRWPGSTPAGGRCDALICHADLMATCAALFGDTLPDDAAEDSISMLPLLRGEQRGARSSSHREATTDGRGRRKPQPYALRRDASCGLREPNRVSDGGPGARHAHNGWGGIRER